MSKLFDLFMFGKKSIPVSAEGNVERTLQIVNQERSRAASAVILEVHEGEALFWDWYNRRIDEVEVIADEREAALWTDLSRCIPPWDCVFTFTGNPNREDAPEILEAGCLTTKKPDGRHLMVPLMLHANYGVFALPVVLADISESGELNDFGFVERPQLSDRDVFASSNVAFMQLFCFQLANCKNIVIQSNQDYLPKMPKGKRNKQFKIKYHTLAISDTLIRREGSEPSGEHPGVSKHICRGSFAHYTEEKKLFGKYTGTFWRPMHIKGSAKHGIVGKEYELSEATSYV